MPVDREPVLREPAHRVSRRAVLMWTIQAVVLLAVLLAGQVVWWLVDDAASRTPHWVVGAVWLVAGAAYAVAMPQWRYRVHRWEATPRAIYTQSGWLRQERRIAPLSRVQTVDLERGPVAQLLRLGLGDHHDRLGRRHPSPSTGWTCPSPTSSSTPSTAAAVAETGDAT